MNTLTQWKLTSHQAIPETRLMPSGLNIVPQFRETETQVWEVYIPNSEPLPTAAINPGNLSPTGWIQTAGGYTRVGSWICEGRGWDDEYANPAPKIYRETWRKVGAWQSES